VRMPTAAKPEKTAGDFLVIGTSPVLIMLLVGSLVFFLIEVFYRGDMEIGIRWTMFWFVVAIVLVSRIGIEQGKGYALMYGCALAAATWIYLLKTHPGYLLGAGLLGAVWWSAHKLTWNCTLIDDEEDASGHGLIPTIDTAAQPATSPPAIPPLEKSPLPTPRGTTPKPAQRTDKDIPRKKPAAPGVWVIYFSLAALPLFGIGQMLLPAEEQTARRIGFALLFAYLTAALLLLVATSFLGLRRYLRQRFLRMPSDVATGWIKSGASVAATVLVVALLLPRPGADYSWKTLALDIDYQLRRASDWAAQFNPAGRGTGRAGREATDRGDGQARSPAEGDAEHGRRGERSRGLPENEQGEQPLQQPEFSDGEFSDRARQLYQVLKWLLLIAGLVLCGWWIFRRRHLFYQFALELWRAVARFFKRLGTILPFQKKQKGRELEQNEPRPFAAFKNPFLTGKNRFWPPEQLVAFTFEALQAWAVEKGIGSRRNETAREFCGTLTELLPGAAEDLEQFAFFYGHAAYGKKLPQSFDIEPVRRIWQQLTAY